MEGGCGRWMWKGDVVGAGGKSPEVGRRGRQGKAANQQGLAGEESQYRKHNTEAVGRERTVVKGREEGREKGKYQASYRST